MSETCLTYALRWRDRVLATLNTPQQLDLMEEAA